jgi:hypothetical protein
MVVYQTPERQPFQLRADLLQGPEGESQSRVAGQNVGVTQVGERIWLVPFMRVRSGLFRR